ncbi:hypothetical protein IWQ62_004014 [Dispira parvispora]|uniref:Palmitoyl-protein thioesterase 1 n=1 Tax=Dispira parvispora TaxID=1520584 RepID=A0A9W8AME7_9FUNG|nr:hypothetical protein IWQ62_004014 [Dispira parvispora]
MLVTTWLNWALTLSLGLVGVVSGKASLQPTPIVVWHGMGDSAFSNDTMLAFQDYLQQLIPGVFVHLVTLGTNSNEDVRASFMGNVPDQVKTVCKQLKAIPALDQGFHGLGFSQGGLFLRAYVQLCNQPPMHNLVTLGSPHGGVGAPPSCPPKNWFCQRLFNQLKDRAYSWYFRDHVVQAQYFKDPTRLEDYRQHNVFLPNINNELSSKSSLYKERLTSLHRWVMVRYQNDTMIHPRDSSWFSSIEPTGPVSLWKSVQYQEDWLGLRTLDERDALVMMTFPGQHLEHNDVLFEKEVLPFLSDPVPTSSLYSSSPAYPWINAVWSLIRLVL